MKIKVSILGPVKIFKKIVKACNSESQNLYSTSISLGQAE